MSGWQDPGGPVQHRVKMAVYPRWLRARYLAKLTDRYQAQRVDAAYPVKTNGRGEIIGTRFYSPIEMTLKVPTFPVPGVPTMDLMEHTPREERKRRSAQERADEARSRLYKAKGISEPPRPTSQKHPPPPPDFDPPSGFTPERGPRQSTPIGWEGDTTGYEAAYELGNSVPVDWLWPGFGEEPPEEDRPRPIFEDGVVVRQATRDGIHVCRPPDHGSQVNTDRYLVALDYHGEWSEGDEWACRRCGTHWKVIFGGALCWIRVEGTPAPDWVQMDRSAL